MQGRFTGVAVLQCHLPFFLVFLHPTSEQDKRSEEERRLSAVKLLKSKWNPKGVQMEGGWRFDPDHL